MSAIVYATEGYVDMLDALTDDLVVQLRLYTNDPELGPGLTAASFVEPVYDGYGAKPVSRWTPAALKSGRAFSDTDPVYWQWTAGAAPAPIRGYYALEPGSGRLLWAWRRPGEAFALGPSNPLLTVLVRLWFPSAP